MMYWDNGMSGWGMLLMTISGLLFWGLIVAGIVVLVRSMGGGGQPGTAVSQAPTPQQVLADRYARGEIDDEEYTRHLRVLHNASVTRGPR